jgi:hypothetical protein
MISVNAVVNALLLIYAALFPIINRPSPIAECAVAASQSGAMRVNIDASGGAP